jgi:hypothetical protein
MRRRSDQGALDRSLIIFVFVLILFYLCQVATLDIESGQVLADLSAAFRTHSEVDVTAVLAKVDALHSVVICLVEASDSVKIVSDSVRLGGGQQCRAERLSARYDGRSDGG